MKTSQSTSDKLRALLESKRAERSKILAECKAEKVTTEAEIEELKSCQAEAETPDSYKRIASQITEKSNYIVFLEKKEKQTRERPILTGEEYKSIENELNQANAEMTNNAAGQILKKFDELIPLMAEYCREADKLQEVLNLAQVNAFGRKVGGHYWHELKEKRPGDNSFFTAFCMAYFKYYEGGRT